MPLFTLINICFLITVIVFIGAIWSFSREYYYEKLLRKNGLHAAHISKRNLFMNIKRLLVFLFIVMLFVIGVQTL